MLSSKSPAQRRLFRILASAAAWVVSSNAAGAELSGVAAFDSRVFFYSPAFPDQRGNTYYPSFMLQPELRHALNDDKDRLSLVPFVRVDPEDDSRNHWDIREMKWLHVGEGWDTSLGVGKVFWGVTESRHLVDIINQTDLVEDIDQEEKLGQPMANVNLVSDYGTFSVFALPRFRERTFENFRGRLRFALPIDDRHPHYESSLGVWHPDFAVRWGHTLGEWDIGVAQFWGTSREPAFDLSFNNPNAPKLIPRYDLINQTSIDVQFTHEAWLWKLEALTRGGQGRRFAAVTAGFEYTVYDTFNSGLDLGLLAEYSYDGRDRNPTVAPPTPFDNDVFFGVRLGFNDEQDTQLLAGSVQDLDTGAKFVNLEASRRIGEAWKVEIKGRFFMDAPPEDFVLYGFRRDDYVQLRIARYF